MMDARVTLDLHSAEQGRMQDFVKGEGGEGGVIVCVRSECERIEEKKIAFFFTNINVQFDDGFKTFL
jgi:hypothetical protein